MATGSGDPAIERIDNFVGNLLRTGVALSGAIVFAGGLVYLGRHGRQMPDYHVFRGEPADLRTLRGIIEDAYSLRGRGVIQLGLLLLIATPISRVTYLVYAFARQGDRLYSLIAMMVLLFLFAGLTSGRT